MTKSKSEIERITKTIAEEYGYFLNLTSCAKVLGVSTETARKLLKNVPPAKVEETKKYYLYDLINYIYE